MWRRQRTIAARTVLRIGVSNVPGIRFGLALVEGIATSLAAPRAICISQKRGQFDELSDNHDEQNVKSNVTSLV